MNKLNRITHYNNETGEDIDKDTYKAIQSEERINLIKELCYKFNNTPFKMTLEEIETYRLVVKKKRSNIIKYKLDTGEFICLIRQDIDMIKKLNIETKSLLFEISMMMNKLGVILYKNHRPIPSFEKLKAYLEIGHTRWSKAKSDIDEYDIIIKKKDKNNRNVLLINPFFTISSTEIDSLRFITFGHLLKDKLDFEDYLYLCKKYDIIPEY